MAFGIVVVIREDPTQTHRPVEALRIALGLSTGPNPLTIILVGPAPLLLSEDTEEVVDHDILERHLPVIKELQIPIVVPKGSQDRFVLDPDYTVSELPTAEISTTITSADCVLVF